MSILNDYPQIPINKVLYHKMHKIGGGGMAEIVLYKNDKGEKAAVKFPTKRSKNAMELFDNEANVMKQLKELSEKEMTLKRNFPLFIGYEPGKYIAMTHETGKNLEKIFWNLKQDEHLLPFPYIIQIAKKIYNAIENIHRLGYLHNDIKTENLGINKEGNLVLFDFGICTKTNEKHPEINGTLNFSSPELDEKEQLTTASDIYSMGILLYQMITGVNRIKRARRLLFPNPIGINESDEKKRLLELKKEKIIGNYKLIVPIKNYRPNDEIPNGIEELIIDSLKTKRNSRPSISESKERLDKIMKKYKYPISKDEEIINYLRPYMNIVLPPSLKTLEELAEERKGFIPEPKDALKIKEELKKGYGSSFADSRLSETNYSG